MTLVVHLYVCPSCNQVTPIPDYQGVVWCYGRMTDPHQKRRRERREFKEVK